MPGSPKGKPPMPEILTPDELAELRRGTSAKIGSPIEYDKATANAIFQVLEDWYEAEKPIVSGLINAATAPVIFSNPVKKAFAVSFLKQKFRRENI